VLAAAVLAEEKADLVAVGRGMVADAEWPNKVRAGRFDEVRACIACNQGCIGGLLMGQSFTCLVNPEAGREWELTLEPAASPKRVFVAGGGPAGMEAARLAAQRGHDVTLYERASELGGQFRIAALPPRKQEITPYLRYLEGALAASGATIVLGEGLSAAHVEEEKPDVVIVATGSRPLLPPIPGLDGDNVVLAADVLTGVVVTGQRVIVAGAGQVGCETAEFLDKYGKEITLVEMRPEIAPDEFSVPRKWLLRNLEQTRIRTLTATRIVEIREGEVVIEREGERETLTGIDTVVLARGAQSEDGLARELEKRAPELYVIGDAAQPGSALDAIAAGAEIGRQL